MRFASSPTRTVAPAEGVITLAEAKAHLRVEHEEDDVLITSYVQAATDRLDGWSGVLGRCLVTQTWQVDMYGFPPDGLIRLPFPGVQSVAVAYVDPDGASQTFSASSYHLINDSMGGRIDLAYGASWPSTAIRPNAVRVTLVAGYGAASAVPQPIKSAIKLMVGDLYANRETVVIGVSSSSILMSTTVDALITPYRRVGI